MTDDSGMHILLTQLELVQSIDSMGKIIDVLRKSIYAVDSSNPMQTNDSGDLVYIIYTSCTYGVPKDIMVEYRNLVNIFWA